MSVWRKTRAIMALTAAYAFALQATLLAIGGPFAGSADFAARPFCSPANSAKEHPAPAGHGYDCLAACLACCCGAPLATAAIGYKRGPARKIAAVADAIPTWRLRVARAYRSRGPPLG